MLVTTDLVRGVLSAWTNGGCSWAICVEKCWTTALSLATHSCRSFALIAENEFDQKGVKLFSGIFPGQTTLRFFSERNSTAINYDDPLHLMKCAHLKRSL